MTDRNLRRRLAAAYSRAILFRHARGDRDLLLRLARPWLWVSRLLDDPRVPPSAEHDPGRPRLLVLEGRVPPFDRLGGAGQLRELMLLFIDLRWSVTLLPGDMSRLEPYASALERLGVRVVSGNESPAAWLAREAAAYHLMLACDLVASPRLLPTVRTVAPHARLVVHRSDLSYVRLEREAALTGSRHVARQAARARTTELALAANANAVITVTPADRARLMTDLPGVRAFTLPRVVDARDQIPARQGREGLVFVGSFLHPPNVDAALWLVREVLPLLHAAVGPIPLTLVGGDPPRSVRALAGPAVRVTGWVPDVERFLDQALVCLCPLRFGSGIKNKVLQAMAAGLPVVSTAIGVEGMAVVTGEHVLLAETASDLANGAARLVREPALWQRLADAGRAYVGSHHSRSALRAALIEALAALDLPAGAPSPAEAPAPASQ
ncbi:MAG: glycosyltransferase [Gemmataceae bacterium]|nr:glycosyltransferase [Gemmataceae bacterium]